jgi:hypothetical protein
MQRDRLAFALFAATRVALICFAEGLSKYFGVTITPTPSGESMQTRDADARRLVSVEQFESVPFSDDNDDCRMMQVVLRNRSPRRLQIIGAANGCRPWGCYEAVNLPAEIAPGGDFVLKIKADWRKTPYQPFSFTLFTSLSVDTTIQLRILPDSVVLQSKDVTSKADVVAPRS